MPLPIPTRLEDLSNEDILDIGWESEFLDQATPLERLLLQRLGEQFQELACAREERRRLLESRWDLQ
jgi:hypothetical protein